MNEDRPDPSPAAERGGARRDLPDVSVIVPAFNGGELLDLCLRAIEAQDYPGSIQTIVVDNASTEDLGAVVGRHPGVLLLLETRRGSYAARNRGLEAATGSVLAFTDADCRPAPSWVREAVVALRAEPQAAMVGGRVEMTYRRGRPRTAGELFELVHGFPQERYLQDQGFAVTANMVTSRVVVDAVGAFDASLQSRGDAQWGQRVAGAGLVQRYAPDAVVYHPAREGLGESITKWRRVAGGRTANDLAQGRRPRHFAGLALAQVRMWVRSVRDARTDPLLHGAGERLRYGLAVSVCRGVTTGIYARALVSSAAPNGTATAGRGAAS